MELYELCSLCIKFLCLLLHTIAVMNNSCPSDFFLIFSFPSATRFHRPQSHSPGTPVFPPSHTRHLPCTRFPPAALSPSQGNLLIVRGRTSDSPAFGLDPQPYRRNCTARFQLISHPPPSANGSLIRRQIACIARVIYVIEP